MYRAALKNEISQSELNYLRDQGLSNKEIALRTGCSEQTISRYLPSLRKARVKLSDKDREDILELYKDGNKVGEIAESYNCTNNVIYRILKSNGVVLKQKKTEAEPVEEKPKQIDIQQSAQPQQAQESGRMKLYQMGLYDGWSGTYRVNLTEHTIEFPELPKTMEKEDLGYYIRDLMQIWKEM